MIMTYAGTANKANNKVPNRQGALEMMRSFTEEEQASPWCVGLRFVWVCGSRSIGAQAKSLPQYEGPQPLCETLISVPCEGIVSLLWGCYQAVTWFTA